MSDTPHHSSPEENIHILYIEDDEANRQLVQFIFKRRGDIEMLEAETGSAGIQSARKYIPDIILLDLSLPDMSGFEVLSDLQKTDITSKIPVIAITGESAPADIVKGMKAGFHAYLTKPINVAALYKSIDDTIAAR